ncbi:hypothetical protein JCM10295v2_006100 [Rhodotorula toruloides]
MSRFRGDARDKDFVRRRAVAVRPCGRNGLTSITKNGQRQTAAFNLAIANELKKGYDVRVPVCQSSLYALAKVNKTGYEIHHRTKSLRVGMFRRLANEFARFLTGRDVSGGNKLNPSMKLLLAVGAGVSAPKGSRVAKVTLPLLREIEDVLRRQRIEYRIVIITEAFTSQRCPVPDCIDSEGRRSVTTPAKLESGSTIRNLLYCATCDVVYNRDGAAAANIAAKPTASS